jgi:competence protein ComEC
VPAPSLFVVVVYYTALGAALWAPQRPTSNVRAGSAAIAALCAIVILTGAAPRVRPSRTDGRLTLTLFDVGQGDAMLLQTPGGRALMVDAGGAGFDGAAFDIGGRVLAPALWARGVRRLDVLAITHADPDHIGGAAALVRDMAPRAVWDGIAVPRHEPQRALDALAEAHGIPVVRHIAGTVVRLDEVTLRVLHPPVPDWERQRVRNDDSLVLEARSGDVAILLTGDISADIERAILPHVTPAPVRILKVAHHGSRTSTSRELLEAWKPQIAVISCGRGNRFGHPAPEVLERLEQAGVRVYRTDRDGQIVITSDGAGTNVRTYVRREEDAATKNARDTGEPRKTRR